MQPVIQSRAFPDPKGMQVKPDELRIEPGLAFRLSLQTTTVAEAVLRVLTNSSRIDSQAQP